MIKVLFFGPVSERIQTRELAMIHTAGMSLQDVINQLNEHYPQLFDIISFIAINGVQVRDRQTPLADNDEIAFMAKFSGG
ncbi:MAG: MoaD/ThiS family protein [Gallionella sp.]|nr:MoaD/ThiS family protein [Gallionella sp.]MDD4946556.1 MoaD/ThiS family protein [Gallionella sp.]